MYDYVIAYETEYRLAELRKHATDFRTACRSLRESARKQGSTNWLLALRRSLRPCGC